MTESTQATLLRRKTRPHRPDVAENPLTSSRAVRLALTKAANDTVGLVLTVQGVAEEVLGLDEMLGTLDDGLMLIGLHADSALSGLIAVDMEMRAAILEMETMGAVLAQPAEARAPTRTDKSLCDPLLDVFLTSFTTAVVGTPLDGWSNGVALGDKLESARDAGLILVDRDYRLVRLTVDLGVADRQGVLIIALPLVHVDAPIVPVPEASVDWSADFREAVDHAPAGLSAQLHRFEVSLATAQALQVGSILPLPGCTVSSVQLLAPDGQRVAQAKLGQVGGYRAVRLETAPAPQLADLPHPAHQGATALIEPDAPPANMQIPVTMSDPVDATADDLSAQMATDDLPQVETQPMDSELS